MTLTEPTAAKTPALDPTIIASVRGLRVHFRSKAGTVHAVDGVDFNIRDGETLGLVGETGCGKSVTARSFLRLVPIPPALPIQGSILFRPRALCTECGGGGCATCDMTGRVSAPCPACDGVGCDSCSHSGAETIDLTTIDLRRMQEIRGNRIAMIFQDPGKALNPALSIRDQLSEVFMIHRTQEILDRAGISGDAASVGGRMLQRHAHLQTRRMEKILLGIPPLRDKRDAINRASDSMVKEALAETQIPNPANIIERHPHELSGGMKQRVMIAQALACNPDLLIADEPTTALDVTVQARIMELVSELQVRHRTAVLYISHDLSLVRRVCDRIAVMYAGRIAEIGPSDQVFHNPQHPYTKGLIGAIPSAKHERGRLNAIEGTVPELIDPEPGCRFASRCQHSTAMCTEADPAPADVGPDHSAVCFIHQPSAGSSVAPSFDRSSR
jgi:oligopeptide/dipeptide ABC transporter ATP-binding protein